MAQTPDVNANRAALNRLFDERLAWQLREFPEYAMSRGDYSNANRLTDNSLEAIERRHNESVAFLDRLHQLKMDGFGPDDFLNYSLFEHKLSDEIEGHRFRTFLAPIDGRSGPQQTIGQMNEAVRFANAEDYMNYLTRLELTPRLIDQTIALLKLGLSEKRTPPRVAMKGVAEQCDALLAGGLKSLAQPFDKLPAGMDPDHMATFRQRFEQTSMPAVRSAVEKLGKFLREEYVSNCRTSIAASDWPEGRQFYEFELHTMTTTQMTPEDVYETGTREVARIRREMLNVIRKSDFMQKNSDAAQLKDDELFAAFVKYLRTDPRFYYTNEEDLLTGYRDVCKRIDAELPRLFHKLPRLSYGVKKIPDFMAPSQTTAYYQPGDVRNSQAGTFYANTYKLNERPKYEMMALALHESVPGHHFQIALAQELEGLPEFRKDLWFHAYGEGWALYAEKLGEEVGLYSNPYEEFGRLTYEMWRACRLVVDPGMHVLGWSRQQAVNFMLANTALTEQNVNAEVDRYISWPGQACAYKLGEMKISELRMRAEGGLAGHFDERAFHDALLNAGALPLNVLEEHTMGWIMAQLQANAQPQE